MKIKIFIILIINIILTQNLASNNVEKKQNSLNEIQLEINALEKKLKEQVETQKNADEKLKEIKLKLKDEKNRLIKNQNEEKYQSYLLKNANYTIDSLKKNALIAKNERRKITALIKEVDINSKIITNQIIQLNDSLIKIKNIIDNKLDSLINVKKTIKTIFREKMFVNAPSDIEFIIESNTWDNFILYTIMYDIVIKNKKESIENLFNKKENITSQYNHNLELQNTMIHNKKELNQKLKQYMQLETRLNQDLMLSEELLKKKETIFNDIIKEYEIIDSNINNIQNKINLLTKEKNEIKNIQKKVDNEKQRIEYALILKKESREKVEKEIKKLLLQVSEYKGTDIKQFKNKLPWPINGYVLTDFGINISETGAKFDYTFIEIVGNEILYLVNQINPKNPNENLVKRFQKLTMGLKDGDLGYGAFGPQTTKKWKEYNKNKESKSIIAIHDGKVEEIKFIDPITGILVIIRHNDQSLSTYSGHIDLIIKENEIVLREQKIGLIKEENILAFQLLIDGKTVNPKNWLVKK